MGRLQSWFHRSGSGNNVKSSSLLTGPTQVVRQYENIRGYSQATHVRAVTRSVMFGKAIVTIDYRDYHIQLRTLPK